MCNSTKIIRYIENLSLIFIYFITKNVPLIVYLDSLLFTLFFEFETYSDKSENALILWIKDFNKRVGYILISD